MSTLESVFAVDGLLAILKTGAWPFESNVCFNTIGIYICLALLNSALVDIILPNSRGFFLIPLVGFRKVSHCYLMS